MKYWQQAAGDTNRNYAAICVKWGVILNGPGYCGSLLHDGPEILRENGYSSKKVTDLKRFAFEMNDGDVVVLRLGTSIVKAVGIIVGDYQWNDTFCDIDGWDLQHVRRVHWFWRDDVDGPVKFNTYDLKQGDTTQVLTSDTVIDWVNCLSIPDDCLTLPELPVSLDRDVTIDDLSEYLFDNGVANNTIKNLVEQIDELIRIAKWYKKFDNPSESETVAYLIVPLLRALGWTPQKMAIEWNRVDIALFDSLPRSDSALSVVVEAKKRDTSCLSALSQAESYAKSRPQCERLIVSDGIRFGIFVKHSDKFVLHSYMNLTRLMRSYPVYGCGGIMESMLAMTPEWQRNVEQINQLPAE